MPPRFGAHPSPPGGCCSRRDGDSPSWGCATELHTESDRNDLGRAGGGPRSRAVVNGARRADRRASAQGGYLSPARRRAAPAGRGTEPMGFRPTPQAAGRRERSDRRVGGSAFDSRPAPRARLSLKPIKPVNTYWVPFSGLAQADFGPSSTQKWDTPKSLQGRAQIWV